jgi:hypothetical protein
VPIAVAALLAGCSGGTNRTDPQVPPLSEGRSIDGIWRKSAIGTRSKTVSCADPSTILIGSPIRDLTVNGLLVETCSPYESINFSGGTSGRYRLTTQTAVEDGSYSLKSGQLTLIRDTVNGVALKNLTVPQAPQRAVYTVGIVENGTASQIVLTPVAQPVALRQVGSTPAFNPDGSLNDSAVAPVANGDGSVNVLILPEVTDRASVNSDLTISVGPTQNAGTEANPPGFSVDRGVIRTFTFQPDIPGEVRPTPAPAP